jgi:SAM-dependent methyltransferase
MSPTVIEYPIYLWQLLNGFRSRHEKMFAQLREQDTAAFFADNDLLRILDLGNGRLRPQYILLKAAGRRVYGIDLTNRPEASVTNCLYGIARWLYGTRCGISTENLLNHTLVCGDVGRLPFCSESFDFITSIAAFEHFLDVPAVLEELWRVLRPRGHVWACIHPFTCPSGGHNVTFTQIPLRRIPPGKDAWDHLRHRRMPFSVPLNQWRISQFLDAFARYFDIIKHYCALREGSELLTPAIIAELSQYSIDELTCHSYVIVARKRDGV